MNSIRRGGSKLGLTLVLNLIILHVGLVKFPLGNLDNLFKSLYL